MNDCNKKYKKIGKDIYEVLEVNSREVLVNKTLFFRKQIEAFCILEAQS